MWISNPAKDQLRENLMTPSLVSLLVNTKPNLDDESNCEGVHLKLVPVHIVWKDKSIK